jgi:peptidyl-prolyl cis-trans isomerase D
MKLEATSDKIFTQATKLEMDAADKDFNKVAKGMGLVAPAVSVKGMDENWNIRKQRTIVRWAFERM